MGGMAEVQGREQHPGMGDTDSPERCESRSEETETLAMEATDTRYQLLYDLLDKIDASDRKILFLYIDCRQMKEIAEITGLSEQAVKQRIYRIKKKLNALKNEE